MFYFFKQKTAYEMRISDWSSDVCSSDLELRLVGCQIKCRVGNVPGVAHLPHRHPRVALGDQRRGVAALALSREADLDQRRVHLARHHRVAADALSRVLHGDALAELDQPGLACRGGDATRKNGVEGKSVTVGGE